MNNLCEYLLNHLILDFDGEVNSEAIATILAEDSTPEAAALRERIGGKNGAEEFLIVLSDCLRDRLRKGIRPEDVEKHIGIFVNS